MLLAQGDLSGQDRSVPRRAGHAEDPAERLYPVSQPAQASSHRVIGSPDAVIFNDHTQHAIFAVRADRDFDQGDAAAEPAKEIRVRVSRTCLGSRPAERGLIQRSRSG